MRLFRTQDFLRLPPLSEAGTLTLVEDLEAAARGTPKVPAGVLGALGRVVEAAHELQRTISLRERAGSSADPRARAADRALDDAWGAFQSWLLGWTQLPERAHPRVKEARGMYETLFPKGLQFLTLDFQNEWKESQERLEIIANHAMDSVIDALGGAAFLATIARAHRLYGEALNIAPTGDETRDPDARVQKALAVTHQAIRAYVNQITAAVDPHVPTTFAAATALLAPIAARKPAVGDDDGAEDETLVSA